MSTIDSAQMLAPDPLAHYAVCELCGAFRNTLPQAIIPHLASTHHLAHVTINRRVREGWLPVGDDLARLLKTHGVEPEADGVWRDLDHHRRARERPLLWVRNEDHDDLILAERERIELEAASRQLIAGMPSSVTGAPRRLRAAAALCRQGVPWWSAWWQSGQPVRQTLVPVPTPQPPPHGLGKIGMVRGNPLPGGAL